MLLPIMPSDFPYSAKHSLTYCRPNRRRQVDRSISEFRCENKFDNVDMHFYSDKRQLLSYYAGIVHAIAELLCSVTIDIVIQPNDSPFGIHHVFHINTSIPIHYHVEGESLTKG
jgi:hypothetical protein